MGSPPLQNVPTGILETPDILIPPDGKPATTDLTVFYGML
jgi:hypothetical protein